MEILKKKEKTASHEKMPTLFQESVYQLRRNPAAQTGLFIIFLFVFVAIFAPLLAQAGSAGAPAAGFIVLTKKGVQLWSQSIRPKAVIKRRPDWLTCFLGTLCALTVRRFILPLYIIILRRAGKYAKNAKGFMKLRDP